MTDSPENPIKKTDGKMTESSDFIDVGQGGTATPPPNPGVCLRVVSGRVEAYACSSGRSRFHKIFLVEAGPGEYIFPDIDTGGKFAVELFAVDETRLEKTRFSSLAPEAARQAVNDWFAALVRQSWLADMDPSVNPSLKAWSERRLWRATDDIVLPDIERYLADNQAEMRRFVLERMAEMDSAGGEKRRARSVHKHKTMAAALGGLVNWDIGQSEKLDHDILSHEEAPFLAVRTVARSLGVDANRIAVKTRAEQRLDQVTLIRKLVEKSGMRMRLVALEKGWQRQDAGAMIGFSGDDRKPVALIPSSRESYRLYDGDNPGGTTVDEAVAGTLARDAFACYAGLPPAPLTTREFFAFVWRRMWSEDWRTIIWISLIAGLLPLIIPMITESIFSDIIPINDRQALGTVTQVMLVSGFATAIISFVRAVACLRLKSRFGLVLETSLWSRLLGLPARFFRDYQVGDLAKRMQNLTEISSLFGTSFATSVFNAVFSFWSLFLMFYYSPRLTGWALAVWAVYLGGALLLQRRNIRYQAKGVEASNRTSALVVELLNGLYAFKLQGNEEQAFSLWSRRFREEWGWNLRQRRIANRLDVINAVQPVILTMVVFYFTVDMYTAGGTGEQVLPFATFMAFQSLFTGFNATIIQFVPLLTQFYGIKPHIENIRPILEAVPETREDKLDAERLRGQIEVKNVFFAYDADSPMVLRDISFTVRPGEFVAFVGTSGCGKSTLLRLLLGFEEPLQGTISYDGQDLASLNAASVRSQMGVVLQNGRLMAGDICTNIIGTAALTLDDAWEAARLVGLEDDIKAMPMGMNTLINEGGGNISGGQRQRILIARSIAGRPRIIIMDEATSALDNRTQKIVAESVKALKATRLTVAHRLSTIVDADRIFVMDDGRIAEEGTYHELLRKNGLFTALARRQLE